ncbi:MAG: GNAT family N-acetyltransferase, partial [Pseudomonadota bacterium]
AMTEIVNEIVRIGGTTAREVELSVDECRAHYIAGPEAICCHVAIAPAGQIIGFQAVGYHPDLPRAIGDIGTYARQTPKIPGVGRALFPATVAAAKDHGLTELNAVIRADNVSGLRYYASIGFVDREVLKAIQLLDGTSVERVMRRYALA